jgi:hypothetical protein
VQRVPTASRRLLVFLLALALATLALPSAASANTLDRHVTGTAGTNGWYTSNVGIYWTFSPQPTMTQGCDARTITTDGTTNLDCKAWWDLSTSEDPVAIKVDKTAPAAHAVPSRPPDANGWYNHPVPVSFAGSDATSGLAGCSSTTYSGPDNGNASVAGTCTDNAGNVGSAAYGFSYDATPPSLGKVTAKHGDRNVRLGWTASPDTQVVQVMRSRGSGPSKLIFRGTGDSLRDKGLRPGAKYQYTVTAFDVAANSATQALTVTATGKLIDPVPGEHVSSPPRLAWLPKKGASYYNVQLIRGTRVLTAWPTHAHLKLPRSWTYRGHHYRLQPGVYRWYVWPGLGPRARGHYGRLLGGSTFVYGG